MFASSGAVYGGEPPLTVDDLTPPTPRTSYGAQKAAGELFVNDYTRRGIIDGRSVRLPTIVVRPGRPNKAASTFASSIIREPLAGQKRDLPVSPGAEWRSCRPPADRRLVDAPRHGRRALGFNRTVLLPSISVSIGEMADSLRRIGGEEAAEPRHLAARAVHPEDRRWLAGRHGCAARRRLGLKADANMDEIVTAFIEDDLPAQRRLVAAG